jgi:hypothetical protein
MTGLGEVLGTHISDKDRIKRAVRESGAPIYIFHYFREEVLPDDTYIKVENRSIGSSFVLGHASYGELGTGQSPQPYLGDSRGSWSEIYEGTGTTAP